MLAQKARVAARMFAESGSSKCYSHKRAMGVFWHFLSIIQAKAGNITHKLEKLFVIVWASLIADKS